MERRADIADMKAASGRWGEAGNDGHSASARQEWVQEEELMRRSTKFALFLCAVSGVLSAPSHLGATTVYSETFTCPIGGEMFEDSVIGSYSSFGQRPDGRPYGTLPIYPVTECPSNGFPLFQKAFSEQEIATLTPIVASAEFKAMRVSETPNYRVWFLASAINPDPTIAANILLRASWESDLNAERKARYQRKFVEAVDAVPSSEIEDWFFLNLRAANAQRELGDFPAAERRFALVAASQFIGTLEPQTQRFLGEFIEGQRILISEENSYFAPANLIGPRNAVRRCSGNAAGLSPIEKEFCAKPEFIAAMRPASEESAETLVQSASELMAVMQALEETASDQKGADPQK